MIIMKKFALLLTAALISMFNEREQNWPAFVSLGSNERPRAARAASVVVVAVVVIKYDQLASQLS